MSQSGSDPLAPLVADPGRSGVLCDFDGTLSPIVRRAADARPAAGAVALLQRLAARYAVVAVISGRPLSFLVERLGPGARDAPILLSGLYGLERSGPDGTAIVLPGAEAWRPVVEAAARSAEADLAPTVDVERKGLSMVVHVRPDPTQAGAAEAWAEAEGARTGLAVHPGRLSWELRPPVPADKGTAVTDLAGGLDAVCFIGDDLGDLPAFAALDRLHDRGVHTVKVAVRSAEVPPEVVDRADIVVDGPAGVLALLARLLPEVS